MAQSKSLAMVDLLFFISFIRKLKIPLAVSNVASRRHKASSASFTGSRTHFKSSRNANSVSDISIAVDKSSNAFMMHLLRRRNLSIISNRAPARFAVKDEGQLLFLFCNHVLLQDFAFHCTFSEKFHNFSYLFQNILYFSIESCC